MSEFTVGVVGAGVMGSAIAQVIAQTGSPVVCGDLSEEVVEEAQRSVRSGRYGFDRAVERGKLTRAEADAALERLRFSTQLSEVAASDLIIECVPEQLDLKIRLFRELDQTAPEHAILASNTSGFPIAALAAATERPDLVIGWHWASPPPVMRLAEIVVTSQTSDVTRDAVCKLARRCGKNPVVVQDAPMVWGFVANRIYSAMVREAQQVVESGIATHEQVNQLMTDAFNWPVGPFAMIRGATQGWKE